ncbi:MAG TPA: 3' terminal RNA ribose 2'-O-methyltransferase Hen1 [Streptosporangiaceae bacterium]
MLLTISTTHRPATDLGYLLHKNPQRLHRTDLATGPAYVFFPEAGENRCTAAVLADIDPLRLGWRGAGYSAARPGNAFPLAQYITDRGYAASSFLSVALARLFGTAMSGRCRERPELAATPLPLEAHLPVLPARGGEPLLRELFEPLGYTVQAEAVPLDPGFPEWGASPYLSVTLASRLPIRDLLEHLYVLLPVLDDAKHYWVGEDEVAKLARRGAGWLPAHPARDLIARRYLRHDTALASEALARLADEAADPEVQAEAHEQEEQALEAPLTLRRQRIAAVAQVIAESGAPTVLDLGCGEGELIAALLKIRGIERVTGFDVSHRALGRAAQWLHMEDMTPRQRARVDLLHGSLTYRDHRLDGYAAAAAVEVIEHLDSWRLAAFERNVFGRARPALVVVTTPNAEYNKLFPGLAAGALRHADHRFEWDRGQFRDWCATVGARYGYGWEPSGIGPADPRRGTPTQMALFRR